MTIATDPTFEALLEFLKRTRGMDLTGYKRRSLERRFRRRMETIECESFADYLDYLEVQPDEYEALFDTLLINVTEFFRDREAWQDLQSRVLPALVAGKPDDEPIRVWSAGCASGQEPYTIAMVLAEQLGVESYLERVKIYATDIDDDALSQARQASYSAREAESVPPELRDRYFEPVADRFAFRTDLRRTIIFGRNNLVQDAPISRLDLLVCRNTLMYFTAESQAQILRNFHFALREQGALMLGKSEMMLSHRGLFAADDLKTRIFVRQPRIAPPTRILTSVDGDGNGDGDGDARPKPGEDRAVRDAALELGPDPLVVVSRSGRLTFANVPARAAFQLGRADLGRQFADLPLAHRPVALEAAIEQALRERRRVVVGEVAHERENAEPRRMNVAVSPLLSSSGTVLGVSVLFEDITRYAALQGQLEANRRDLELAYEELQSTIDELETTNEELQSANEELQTTNEELQSTNEELETMNEELQSTNEELETINEELRERTGELNEVNDFLEAILTSLGLGVAVLDAQQRVQIWNHRAEDLWGLRRDEAIDQHFLGLDIGLPAEDLAAPLRAVLAGVGDREIRKVRAVNRRGRTIVCTATVLPLLGGRPEHDGHVRGAIVLMEDQSADGA